MRKYTQKELRGLCACGMAQNINDAGSRDVIPNTYTQIGYSTGVYGCNGALLQDDVTGEWYAITARNSALYIFV